MRVSRLSVFGNALVFGLLALGAWIWWRNVSRSADPPSASVAVLAEGAAKVGIDRSDNAPRVITAAAGPAIIGPSGLAVPVVGIAPGDLVDTFTQSRAGGNRVHNAIDIMAERGRPVISATDGVVEKLYFSRGGGGITAYIRSTDGRWMHYYAHLDAYATSLRQGQRIRRGDPIGTVGISGNANPAGPHLHYAVYQMQPGERWWQGQPVNPYPLLAGTASKR